MKEITSMLHQISNLINQDNMIQVSTEIHKYANIRLVDSIKLVYDSSQAELKLKSLSAGIV